MQKKENKCSSMRQKLQNSKGYAEVLLFCILYFTVFFIVDIDDDHCIMTETFV